MMRLLSLLAIVCGTADSLALAKTQQGTSPRVGIETTATIGGVMLEEYRFTGVPGVILKASITANWGSLENVDLPAGTGLAVIREKRLKACQTRTNLGWVNCVIDTDSDGRIDRVSFNDVAGGKDVRPPVDFEPGLFELSVNPRFGEAQNFKKQLVYTGSTSDTLTISYREFVNDLARPAFTEALIVPLGTSFPQTIAIKDRVFSVLRVDGMGLHYVLIK